MRMKGWSAATAALVVACGLAAPGAVAAPAKKKLEPLNQYVVTGGDLQVLGKRATTSPKAGAQQARPRHRGHTQPSGGSAQKGFTVTAPYGEEKAAKAAPPDPFATNPTHGFNVYRPWRLQPAPCPGTCSGAVNSAGQPINLKTWYENLRAANPDIVKKVVYGKSRYNQDLVAYKVSHERRTRWPTARSPSSGTSRPSTRASGSRPRRSGACSRTCSPTATTTRPTSRRCCATRRCGSCRSSTSTATTGPSSRRPAASGGATCATTTTTTS